MGERSGYKGEWWGVVAKWAQLGEPRAWWGRAKKEAVRKVVNMYALGGLGDASDANDAE